MKNQHVVAALVLVAVVVWMLLPRDARTVAETPPAEMVTAIPEGQSVGDNDVPFTVRVATIAPQSYVEQVRVRGRTQAFRHVQVRAEQSGRIISEPVARGARVNTGDVLCEIAVDTRSSDLQEARSRLEQAEFEYQAALDLQQRDLQSDVIVAQLKAALESARAAVARAELSLQRTKVVAPFAGIVETRTVELGDLLNAGTVCASVLDDDPMLLVGLIPEHDIGKMALGAQVDAELLTGEKISGTVTYLAQSADASSRSYRLEVQVSPGQTTVRDGITAELMVRAAESQAHLIPSSALTIDDNGDVGIKVVNGDNSISFQTVTIIGDNTNQMNPGVWVHGLSGNVNLVTHGQELVFPGQIVRSNFDWSTN